MTLISYDGDFAYVEYAGQRGYVLATYIEPKSGASGLAAASTAGEAYIADCEEYITLRAGPDVEAEALGTIPRGGEMTLAGFDGAFALVRVRRAARVRALDLYRAEARLRRARGGAELCRHAHGAREPRGGAPDAVTLSSIGRSVEGRELLCAVVGGAEAEYDVLIQGCIHGREGMSAYLVLSQLEHLLEAGAPEDVRFHFIPMVNPDGAEISRTGRLGEAQRAIYESDLAAGHTELGEYEYAREWKANAAGVDLNRNFDAGWESLESRSAPSSENYRGAAPEDQPESRALADYTRLVKPDATLSYHTAGA